MNRKEWVSPEEFWVFINVNIKGNCTEDNGQITSNLLICKINNQYNKAIKLTNQQIKLDYH